MSSPGFSSRADEPMARHTVARVGGRCERYVVVHRADALANAMDSIKAEGLKVTVLGQGTRMVVRDGGVSGAVVRLGHEFSGIVVQGQQLVVGAMAPICLVARVAAELGLTGLESFANHPGSLGASLVHDAGPEGGWDAHITEAQWFARGGVRTGPIAGARKLKHPFFLQATLALPAGTATAVGKAMAKTLSKVEPASWWKPLARGSLRGNLARTGLAGVRVKRLVLPAAAPELVCNLGDTTAKELAFFERMVVDRVRRERGIELATRMVWTGSHGGTG